MDPDDVSKDITNLVDELIERIKELESDDSDNNQKVLDLEEKISELEEKISELEDEISDLGDTIEELRLELKEKSFVDINENNDKVHNDYL